MKNISNTWFKNFQNFTKKIQNIEKKTINSYTRVKKDTGATPKIERSGLRE